MGGITSRISKAPITISGVLDLTTDFAVAATVAISLTGVFNVWQELGASVDSVSGVAADVSVAIGGGVQQLAATAGVDSLVAIDLSVVVPAIETPAQILVYGSMTLSRWHRGDSVVLSSGKVAQWTDLSGNGNHGIGTSPRQPTWLADAGNGLPAVQGLGDNEAGTSNRDELRWPGYARPAPGTTPNFQIIVWRKDGNELGLDRMLVADSTSKAFQLKRPSATVPDMAVVNGTSNEFTLSAYVQDTVICTEWFLNNSLESYHKVQGVIAAGSFGGNNVGTAACMFVNQAGTAWMAATVFELMEFRGIPNALQMAKIRAYLTNRYTGLLV